MNTLPRVSSVNRYKGHRFPAEIISHCVWLYFRFSLSFRDVEEMMAERGVVVSYESIREWCLKFGAAYAKRIRAYGARPGDRWHLDEVFLKIQGKLQYLWRASTRTARCSTSSFSRGGTNGPPRSSCASC